MRKRQTLRNRGKSQPRKNRHTFAKSNSQTRGALLRMEPLEERLTLAADFFVVPGATGAQVTVNFQCTGVESAYYDEIGVYKVTSETGLVAGLTPGSAGYAKAALTAGQTIFASGETAGAAHSLTFTVGDRLAFYVVANNTRIAVLANNPTNLSTGPHAFFSVDSANADGVDHVLSASVGGGSSFSFEDLWGGGDRDYNDIVITAGVTGLQTTSGATGQTVATTFQLLSSETAFRSEVGYFLVDSATGAVGGVLPGQAGYASAVMNSTTRHTLFRAGDSDGTSQTFDVPSNCLLAFYLVQDSTAQQFLAQPTGSKPVVLFTLPGANSDGLSHAAWQSASVFGFEDLVGGGDRDFNDVVVKVSFGTVKGVAETAAPVITAQLKTDTNDATRSATATDKITSNPTITGTVTDSSQITSFKVGLDSTTTANFADVLATLSNGTFTLETAKLNAVAGGTLSVGLHTLKLQAVDKWGNTSAVKEFQFTYDTSCGVTLLLEAASDTGVTGEFRTDTKIVGLTGQTDANAAVILKRIATDGTVTTLGSSIADSTGKYVFTNVTLDDGPNALKVYATDDAGNTAQSGATITLNNAPTVASAIGPVNVLQDAAASTFDLSTIFGDADNANKIAQVNTSMGTFNIQLFNSRTPGHAANFANYVNDDDYDSTFIHRAIEDFIVQGGGFEYLSGLTPNFAAVTQDTAVTNEPGLPNSRGTIALAKVSGDASSGTSQWFFNVADNVSNLDNQNGGFTVFGQVVGSGQTIVDAIAALNTQSFTSSNSAFTNVPVQSAVTGTTIQNATAANLVMINSVTMLANPITYSVVSNSATTLVTPSIAGNNLSLQDATGATGTANITIRATDTDGSYVDHTFTVTVSAPTP